MPVRMVKDREQPAQDNYPGQGGGGQSNLPGGCAGGNLLPIILSLFTKNPKQIIIVLVLVGAFFLFNRKCGGILPKNAAGIFSLGADMDQKVYDSAEVFEPLADNVKNPLPERVSLEKYCPRRLNQGQQGSCVAWASAYAARSIINNRETGQNPDSKPFSPSFLYNQIGLEGCNGSYIIRAMENMKDQGALPLSEFPYNDEDCSKQPSRYQLQSAEQYKTRGFNRLSKGGEDYKTDMLAVKQNLAQGAPVVIGMMVGGSFMQDMLGKRVWIPNTEDYEMSGFGGHAMCVIGYDDYLDGGKDGAFQIMNSWGGEWGEKGIAWVRYKDFDYFVKEAYGLYPMGSAEKYSPDKFKAEISLVIYRDTENATVSDNGNYIPLRYRNDITYATTHAIPKGTKFKLEVTNSIECYTYVFGQETDGSSYVLFPYTQKHSPYCGITGTRLFPKDYSMQLDEVGNKDIIAIVMTKKSIDYKALNESINRSTKRNYAEKIRDALQDQLVEDVNFSGKENISFECNANGKNAVVLVIEIDKQ